MKTGAIFLLFLVMSPVLTLAAECIVGIDDYCDPQCIPVDFDCEQNPRTLHQDATCIPEPDGVCDENCLDSDWDCITQRGESISPEAQILLETPPSTSSTSTTSIISFDDRSLTSFQIILLSGGLMLLAGLVLLFFHQLRQRKNLAQYAPLHW